MNTYKVVVLGMGKRGKHHASAFQKNPRFELAGVADPVAAQLEKAAPELGRGVRTATDPAALLKEVKPDLFCFCTPPSIRLELIRLGVSTGAKLIAYEKPIALSMNEALEIRKAVKAAGVKTVVSHQHRYGKHYAKVREIVASGALGRVHTVYATAVGWFMHMMTHLVDYMSWYNGYAPAEWVMAQAAGRSKFADNHPSPDYVSGVIHFSNGVRGVVECGAGAPDVPEVDYWWRKNRIGALGTDGFAEALTGGGWRAVTKGGAQSGDGSMDYEHDMGPYVQEMADWLDDDQKVHPCNGENAHLGMEISMGLLRSIAERGQVRLPLGPSAETELDLVKKALPDRPVILSLEASRKEYPAAAPK
jgi:predicted dehydrogenase